MPLSIYVSLYAIKVAFRLKKPFSELRFPWGKTNIFSPPPPLPPLFSKMTAKVNSSFLKDILKLTAGSLKYIYSLKENKWEGKKTWVVHIELKCRKKSILPGQCTVCLKG